jgi:hypothetical protein
VDNTNTNLPGPTNRAHNWNSNLRFDPFFGQRFATTVWPWPRSPARFVIFDLVKTARGVASSVSSRELAVIKLGRVCPVAQKRGKPFFFCRFNE